MAVKYIHRQAVCVGAYDTHPKSAPERTNHWIYLTDGLSVTQVRVFSDTPLCSIGDEGIFTLRVQYPDNPPYFLDSYKFSLEGYSPSAQI